MHAHTNAYKYKLPLLPLTCCSPQWSAAAFSCNPAVFAQHAQGSPPPSLPASPQQLAGAQKGLVPTQKEEDHQYNAVGITHENN